MNPTQVKRPWRATVRTTVAVMLGVAAGLPLLVDAAGIPESVPGVGVALGVAGAITRIMALPWTEQFLARFLPWLAADPDSQQA